MTEPTSSTFRVTKTFNNNVLGAVSSTGERVVLTGRGIGWGRSNGDVISHDGVDLVYVLGDDLAATRAEQVLTGLDPAVLDVAREVLAAAASVLMLRNPAALLLPLADHIAFILERHRQGTSIDFPLQWEVREMYPTEVSVGDRAVALVRERLGVQPDDGEETAFALHFVAGQITQQNIGAAVRGTQLIAHVLKAVAQCTGQPVDTASLAGRRFVVHLRFLLARLEDAAPATVRQAADPMAAAISAQASPKAHQAVDAVAKVLEDERGAALSQEERAYLALHLHLLVSRGGLNSEPGSTNS